MARLRRMSEQIGYGYRPSEEELHRVRMAQLRQRQEDLEREREMIMAQERQERWANQGATHYSRRPFTPQTMEEYREYDPRDVHRGSVRRMDDGTSADYGRMDPRLSAVPRGAHVMDDVGLLEDLLMESVEVNKQAFDQRQAEREMEAMQHIAWEESQLAQMGLRRADGSRLSGASMTSNRVTRTANEEPGGNRFGLRDYANVEFARQQHEEMKQRCADRKNSIKRKYASEDERRQEIFDRERVRSATMQEKFAMSQTLGNLSDRLREMDDRQRGGQRDPYAAYPEEYQAYFRRNSGGGGSYGGHSVNYV